MPKHCATDRVGSIPRAACAGADGTKEMTCRQIRQRLHHLTLVPPAQARTAEDIEAVIQGGVLNEPHGAGTPRHGLYPNKMALITSDCGKMRFLSIK